MFSLRDSYRLSFLFLTASLLLFLSAARAQMSQMEVLGVRATEPDSAETLPDLVAGTSSSRLGLDAASPREDAISPAEAMPDLVPSGGRTRAGASSLEPQLPMSRQGGTPLARGVAQSIARWMGVGFPKTMATPVPAAVTPEPKRWQPTNEAFLGLLKPMIEAPTVPSKLRWAVDGFERSNYRNPGLLEVRRATLNGIKGFEKTRWPDVYSVDSTISTRNDFRKVGLFRTKYYTDFQGYNPTLRVKTDGTAEGTSILDVTIPDPSYKRYRPKLKPTHSTWSKMTGGDS